MNAFAETNRLSSELKTIHGWIRRKLGVMRNKSLTKYKLSEVDINENKYNPKHIARLLAEKHPAARALFYFGRNDYITLSSNGHLNVRGGGEELFKAWGLSEFGDFKPQTIFRELENELLKIAVRDAAGNETHSFDSYSAFLDWLGYY
ncbi:MAG TPA: hypothetical protein VNN20_06790 [Thermodesulfobacteriota bacterium]|nr:hypothetical protein [Thermodesulfobacteriota bacterium]